MSKHSELRAPGSLQCITHNYTHIMHISHNDWYNWAEFILPWGKGSKVDKFYSRNGVYVTSHKFIKLSWQKSDCSIGGYDCIWPKEGFVGHGSS